MNKTWFKTTLTDEEFLDVLVMSKIPHGIRDAALKYKCSKQVIRSRIKSGNVFKGLPTQNRTKYSYNDKSLTFKKKEHYFVFGLLASDGCVIGNRLALSQSGNKGKYLLHFVKGILGSNHNIAKYGNVYHINIKTEEYFNKRLKECNITERKTYTYTLPMFASDEHFFSFLQGYIEGDGCIGIYNNGKGTYCLHLSVVGTKEFIHAVNEKLPIKGHISNTKNELHQLTFNGIKAFKLFNIFYKNPIYPRGKYKHIAKSYLLYKEQLSIKKLYDRVLQLVFSKTHPLSELSKRFNLSVKLIYNLKWKRKKLYQKNLNNTIKIKDL
tara:strand:+ start:16518 stop:17489 length:972 start_codon:yes stop_codon:yes gene_type:complete